MFINKTGFEHTEYGINNQDFGINNSVKLDGNFKCIVDGCSEGKHSEVGAKLFCHLIDTKEIVNEEAIKSVFCSILDLIGREYETVRNFLCFTILYVVEQGDKFVVYTCGDGYIIKQKVDGEIEYEKVDNGEFPVYFAYNYVGDEHLNKYKGGVSFEVREYSKEEYKNVGVASDGLRYIFDKEFEEDFTTLVSKGKVSAIKRLINREHKHFKDDITLVI